MRKKPAPIDADSVEAHLVQAMKDQATFDMYVVRAYVAMHRLALLVEDYVPDKTRLDKAINMIGEQMEAIQAAQHRQSGPSE